MAARKHKHSICDAPTASQHHPVPVHRHRGEGVAVRWRLDHPVDRQVVHSCVFVLAVAPVVGVSRHVTHHAAVGANDSQELVEVPREADAVGAARVDRDVT